jgi:hypothetical protein
MILQVTTIFPDEFLFLGGDEVTGPAPRVPCLYAPLPGKRDQLRARTRPEPARPRQVKEACWSGSPSVAAWMAAHKMDAKARAPPRRANLSAFFMAVQFEAVQP